MRNHEDTKKTKVHEELPLERDLFVRLRTLRGFVVSQYVNRQRIN